MIVQKRMNSYHSRMTILCGCVLIVMFIVSSCSEPKAPTNLQVTACDAYSIGLSWDAVDGASGYILSWNTGAGTESSSDSLDGASAVKTTIPNLTPNTHYYFSLRSLVNNRISQNVSVDTITAKAVFSIVASADGGGSITPSGVHQFPQDTSIEFKVSSTPGYVFDSLVVNKSNLGPEAVYPVGKLSSDMAIHAYFSQKQKGSPPPPPPRTIKETLKGRWTFRVPAKESKWIGYMVINTVTDTTFDGFMTITIMPHSTEYNQRSDIRGTIYRNDGNNFHINFTRIIQHPDGEIGSQVYDADLAIGALQMQGSYEDFDRNGVPRNSGSTFRCTR
jgi:hypothetical protein